MFSQFSVRAIQWDILLEIVKVFKFDGAIPLTSPNIDQTSGACHRDVAMPTIKCTDSRSSHPSAHNQSIYGHGKWVELQRTCASGRLFSNDIPDAHVLSSRLYAVMTSVHGRLEFGEENSNKTVGVSLGCSSSNSTYFDDALINRYHYGNNIIHKVAAAVRRWRIDAYTQTILKGSCRTATPFTASHDTDRTKWAGRGHARWSHPRTKHHSATRTVSTVTSFAEWASRTEQRLTRSANDDNHIGTTTYQSPPSDQLCSFQIAACSVDGKACDRRKASCTHLGRGV